MKTDELHALDMACAKLMNFKSVKSIEQTKHDRPTMRRVVVREHDYVVRYFEPTTSRADAMEVLEWCLKRTDILLTDTNGVMGVNNPDREIDAKTLPIAICKFALEVGRGKG